MTREVAAVAIFNTEAKHKGWITEGPDAVAMPSFEPMVPMEEGRQDYSHNEQEYADEEQNYPSHEQENYPSQDSSYPDQEDPAKVSMPGHIKLNAIQEKLLAQSYGGGEEMKRTSRWGPGEEQTGFGAGGAFPRNPPLAVQQAMALSGGRGGNNPPQPSNRRCSKLVRRARLFDGRHPRSTGSPLPPP